jgi:hypothetical protein
MAEVNPAEETVIGRITFLITGSDAFTAYNAIDDEVISFCNALILKEDIDADITNSSSDYVMDDRYPKPPVKTIFEGNKFRESEWKRIHNLQ